MISFVYAIAQELILRKAEEVSAYTKPRHCLDMCTVQTRFWKRQAEELGVFYQAHLPIVLRLCTEEELAFCNV